MGKKKIRSYLSSGIWDMVFRISVLVSNIILPRQNLTPPGIWGRIPRAWRLGSVVLHLILRGTR